MKINHVGYAVKNLEKAKDLFKGLGFLFEEKVYNDSDRNLFITFGSDGNYRIELLQKMNNSLPSPIDIFIQKNGPIPYHFCYSVTNIEEGINDLKENGFIVINEPAPAIAFNNKKVCFLYNRSIGIIELVEEE